MANSAAEQLLGWSYKHNGDWDKIYADVSSKQPFDFSVTPLADIKSKLYGKYITLLDSDYPDYIRSRVAKAPWCIFYRGDVNLLNENNAIGIVAHRISISQAINKYSTYALVQAIKRYAPKNHIYLQISDEYRELAFKTFKKYAGEGKQIIEFTDKSLKDYDMSYPANQQANLVMSVKWDTNPAPSVAEFQLFTKTCEKIVVVECPPAHTSVADIYISTGLADNKDIEVVPYPFFDSYHANNDIIADGALVFLCEKEDK